MLHIRGCEAKIARWALNARNLFTLEEMLLRRKEIHECNPC